MEIMQVFYDNLGYPFKDRERTVRYPIVGNAFSGASLTTEIRFYVRDIGGVDGITWIANAKRADGKIAYKQLSATHDDDVNEYYVSLQLSQWFTEKKGDLFIALNGYGGGVDITVDSESGLYTVSGTPIIQATGSVKITIAYAPIMNNGYGSVPLVSVQEALGVVSSKLDKNSTKYIKLLDSLAEINSSSNSEYLNEGDIIAVRDDGNSRFELFELDGTYPNFEANELAIYIEYGYFNDLIANSATFSETDNVMFADTNESLSWLLYQKADKSDTYTKEEVNTFAKSLEVSINTSTYVMTSILRDANGNVLSTQSIDLPLETMVVGGNYDDETESLILTLNNGQNITIPVHDLIDGLVDTTTFENALATKQDKLVSGTNIKTINGTSLLDSGNYDFDSELSDSSTNAVQNKVVNAELENKANVDGNYPTMSVGQADSIASNREIEDADEACPPITFGSAGGSAEIQTGYNKFEELRGNSVCWNQGLRYGRNSTYEQYGFTLTQTSNGIIRVNGTSTSDNWFHLTNNLVMYLGKTINAIDYFFGRKTHKFLLRGMPSNTPANVYMGFVDSWNSNRRDTGSGVILDGYSLSYCQLAIKVYSGLQLTNFDIQPQIFDLTEMFGAGNEPTSITDFNRLFPLSYYEYNAGTLLNSKSSLLESIGMNQWDEQWELGSINSSTGATESGSSVIRSKNFTKVIQGETYIFVRGTYSGTCRFYLYDGNKKYIDYYTFSQDRVFEMPSNCCYIKITLGDTTYHNDVMIRLYYDTPNIPYKTHEKQIVELPNIELASAGSAYDVAYSSGGGKRRIHSYTFTGNEYNDYYSTSKKFVVIIPNTQPKSTYPINTSSPANAKTDFAPVMGRNIVSNDLSIQLAICRADISNQNRWEIRNLNYDDTTVDNFKSWLAGKTIYYELVEEQDIENNGWTELVKTDNYGTLQFNSSQTIQVPQAYFIKYTVSLVEWLDTAYTHSDGAPNDLQLHSELNNDITIYFTSISGYDATKTQTLKNVNGTFTWVDD